MACSSCQSAPNASCPCGQPQEPERTRILYCDASHYRLTGGELSAIAVCAVVGDDGTEYATQRVDDIDCNSSERRAIRLALGVARTLPGPVEIRTDCQSAARSFDVQARKEKIDARVIWKPRRGNKANAVARRELKREVEAMVRNGYVIRHYGRTESKRAQKRRRKRERKQIRTAADTQLLAEARAQYGSSFDPWRWPWDG